MANLIEQIEALKKAGVTEPQQIYEVLVAQRLAGPQESKQRMPDMTFRRATASLHTTLSFCLEHYRWDQIGELIEDADKLVSPDEQGGKNFIELVQATLQLAELWGTK